MQKIRVILKSFDHKVIDKAGQIIIDTATASGAKISGPVPLPNNSWVMGVHRSPHVDAKSKEHFGLTTHKRLIDVSEYNNKTIENLTHLQVPAGVDIQIKVIDLKDNK